MPLCGCQSSRTAFNTRDAQQTILQSFLMPLSGRPSCRTAVVCAIATHAVQRSILRTLAFADRASAYDQCCHLLSCLSLLHVLCLRPCSFFNMSRTSLPSLLTKPGAIGGGRSCKWPVVSCRSLSLDDFSPDLFNALPGRERKWFYDRRMFIELAMNALHCICRRPPAAALRGRIRQAQRHPRFFLPISFSTMAMIQFVVPSRPAKDTRIKTNAKLMSRAEKLLISTFIARLPDDLLPFCSSPPPYATSPRQFGPNLQQNGSRLGTQATRTMCGSASTSTYEGTKQ